MVLVLPCQGLVAVVFLVMFPAEQSILSTTLVIHTPALVVAGCPTRKPVGEFSSATFPFSADCSPLDTPDLGQYIH